MKKPRPRSHNTMDRASGMVWLETEACRQKPSRNINGTRNVACTRQRRSSSQRACWMASRKRSLSRRRRDVDTRPGRAPPLDSRMPLPRQMILRVVAAATTRSVSLVGLADFLGELVPGHAVAEAGAQLPLERLGLRLDPLAEGVQPSEHDLALDRELVDSLAQALGVERQRAVQAPLLGREPGDVGIVDPVLVVLADLVVEEER